MRYCVAVLVAMFQMRCCVAVLVAMFLSCSVNCDEAFGDTTSVLIQTDTGFHKKQPASALDPFQTFTVSAVSATFQTTEDNINDDFVSYNDSYTNLTLKPFEGDISNQEETWASTMDDSAFINNSDINGSNIDLHDEGFTDGNLDRFKFERLVDAEEYVDLITSGHFQKRNRYLVSPKHDDVSIDNGTTFENDDVEDDSDDNDTTAEPVQNTYTAKYENKNESIEYNLITDEADIPAYNQNGGIRHTNNQSNKDVNIVEQHTVLPLEDNKKTTEFTLLLEMIHVDGNRSENIIFTSTQQSTKSYFSTTLINTRNADLVLTTTHTTPTVLEEDFGSDHFSVNNDETPPAQILSHTMKRIFEGRQKNTASWNRGKKNMHGIKGRERGHSSGKRARGRHRN